MRVTTSQKTMQTIKNRVLIQDWYLYPVVLLVIVYLRNSAAADEVKGLVVLPPCLHTIKLHSYFQANFHAGFSCSLRYAARGSEE